MDMALTKIKKNNNKKEHNDMQAGCDRGSTVA